MCKHVFAFLLCGVLLAAMCACVPTPASTSMVVSLPVESTVEPLPAPLPAVPVYTLPLANGLNPLTGLADTTLQQEARPVAIMVGNNPPSLPQRGVAEASLVFETLTEGGITRLMAVYPDTAAVPVVGPVRSTRDSFVQFVLPQHMVLASIGGSIYATNLLNILDYQSINGIYLGTTAFWFDAERHKEKANEYCWYTSGGLLEEGMTLLNMPKEGETQLSYFLFGSPAVGESPAQEVSITYSAVAQSGFVYNTTTQRYEKNFNGQPHADEDGAQLAFANLFVLECAAGLKPDEVLLDMDLTGGTGWYFTGGAAQPITWEKQAPNGVLQVFDTQGMQLVVQPGSSYIGVLPKLGSSTLEFF